MATKRKKAKKKAVPKRVNPTQLLLARFSNVEAVVQGILDALSKAVSQRNESMTAMREAIERLDFNVAGLHTLQTIAERVEAVEVAIGARTPPQPRGLGEQELAEAGIAVPKQPTDAELLS